MLTFFKESLMGQYITVFIVSMVPLIELRGAIPFAYAFSHTATGFNLLMGYILIAI